MHSFKRKTIGNGSTLAEQLITARTNKNLTIKNCSKELNIQEKFLNYIESSEFSLLPGEAYARQWVRQYSTFLGLDPKQCLNKYQQEKKISVKLDQRDETDQTTRKSKINLNNLLNPRTLRLLLIVVTLLGLLGYISIFMFHTFQPPAITFDQPFIDQQTQESFITVSGTITPGSQMLFNDQAIVVNIDGKFSQEIPLIDGLNILTIHAKKKHSRSYEKTIQIVKTSLPQLINP